MKATDNSEIVPVVDQDLFQEIFLDTSKQSILQNKSFFPTKSSQVALSST